jgi:16S rRNA A1518/A1519 N6-dimethyltransferase RsmA/KsgA/DIM1 with predicted DNA glycosylase/AP lyase activity
MTPLQNLRQLNEQSFEEVVRGVFTQRRRLTRSALAHFLTKRLGRESARKIISEIVVPDARVFQLSIAQLEDLSEHLAPRLGDNTASEVQDDD